MKYYTGIGSRKTPSAILALMGVLARIYVKAGYTLRSGGANGADSAFHMSVAFNDGLAEIFLPWPKFNGKVGNDFIVMDDPHAMELAASIHPAWDKCSQGARKLHARNCHQVLGRDLETPSEFIVCWTPGGLDKGGTAIAIKLARMYDIPVYNLFHKDVRDRIKGA